MPTATASLPELLKQYQRRLLNLSGSNRSLVLLKPSSSLHLDLHALDHAHKGPSFDYLKDLLVGRPNITLCPVADARDAALAPLTKQFKTIQRRAHMIWEERGAKELFVGWPFVEGAFPEGTLVRCPLLFFPVELRVNEKRQWQLTRPQNAPAFFNKSFLLAYAHYLNLKPDEALLEEDFDEFPPDDLPFRTKLYELLRDSTLDVHFNQELLKDALQPFKTYKRGDLEKTWKPGQLKLQPEAVLGVFPQAGSYQLTDYDDLLENPPAESLEELLLPQTEVNSTQAQLEQQLFTAFDADSSQEAALRQVKAGQSVVVQGPPGTGKSQLICNLVSDYLARGKSVLVVCQKRAALDVVYQRLSTTGLDQFSALVHDLNLDRPAVFSKIRQQIEQVEEYKRQNVALGNIQAERQFLETSRRINQISERLNGLKEALFDASLCGWSPKELYLRSNPRAPHLPAEGIYQQFTAQTWPEWRPRLLHYLQDAGLLLHPDFPWNERRSFHLHTWAERQKLAQLLAFVPGSVTAMAEQVKELMPPQAEPWDALQALLQELPTLQVIQTTLQDKAVSRLFFGNLAQNKDQQPREALLAQLQEETAAAPIKLTPEEAAEVTQLLAAHDQAQSGFFSKIGWGFSSAKKRLSAFAQGKGIAQPDAAVEPLRAALKQLEPLQAQWKSLRELEPTLEIPHNIFSQEAARELGYLRQAWELRQTVQRLLAYDVLPDGLLQVAPARFSAVFQETLPKLQALQEQRQVWLQWFTPSQLEAMITSPGAAQQMTQSLHEHFDRMVAFDALVQTLSPELRAWLEEVRLAVPQSVEAQLGAMENSVLLAWLQQLEGRSPVLTIVSTGELERLETELQEKIRQKADLSRQIILLNLREQTYQNMEYNRLGNPVTYRRLLTQVSKKRMLYPLRKLNAEFGDEIRQLLPCWLASPETVSALFPLERIFDLVIFDEASQCFAEVGVPAMVRAKQAVIAGDEQQLGPSDLYRVRFGTDEEETEELLVESLLQLSALHLPQTLLSEHYRSQYPELIQFSNQNFYREKLQLIPRLEAMNAAEPALQYLKVDGVWDNQTNRVEAERVRDLVFELLGQGQTNIGVITFNFPQQQLVQDLLEEQAQVQNVPLPQELIVKNIENIQGDERQYIIFSIGYAPDASGVVRAMFGSLNAAKGENRLNVAITRAIKRVYVVTSLWPEQFPVEQVKHPGPRLLRDYLAFAREVSERGFTPKPQAPAQVPSALLLYPRLLETFAQNSTNLKIALELPFADLTLRNGNRYQAVVLTDDDLYFRRPSAKASHADVPLRLQARGWKFGAVYSRQFWSQPQQVWQRLTELT
ncbi:AAA domain-containing protein [Rufibacter psychrotolerans]|uniref:AAA domain-containing protein n=1 Tax=Rufibacter psychrotolerans TaxID=2812556 RepID=UPI0019679970|nr:AAA domain-containing protein [Rufibacter sp. SYSU D00308]